MQAKIKNEPYEYFDTVFDGCHEVPIDTEYNLPDYCADIQKILKCRAVPEISTYSITEDILSCEGVCDIRILYLDSKGDCVRCVDFTKSFSAQVKLKTNQEKAVAFIKACVEHMTCRAVSARKIDLHLAVALHIQAVVQKKEMIASQLLDGTIEKRGASMGGYQAVNAVCHHFSLEDSLTLKNGKPPIEAVYRKEVNCKINECRPAEDRLFVTGRADVSFLYLSSVDGMTLEKMNAGVEFSQIIDCAGANENCTCDVRVVCGESSLQPREDSVGESTEVNVVLKVFIVAFLYEPCEINLITDAYSVGAPIDLHYAQSAVTETNRIFSEVLKKKTVLTVSEDEIQKVADLWCEQESIQSYCEKGKLNYRVKYCICLLYLNSQGKYIYTERALDYNFSTELDDLVVKKSESQSQTEIWEYRIADKNTLEVTAETSVVSLLTSKSNMKYLSSAEMDETAKPAWGGSKLRIYYARQGEALWDIAKEHRALLADVRNQNDLYEDVVPEARPIIICNR